MLKKFRALSQHFFQSTNKFVPKFFLLIYSVKNINFVQTASKMFQMCAGEKRAPSSPIFVSRGTFPLGSPRFRTFTHEILPPFRFISTSSCFGLYQNVSILDTVWTHCLGFFCRIHCPQPIPILWPRTAACCLLLLLRMACCCSRQPVPRAASARFAADRRAP